MDNLRRKDIDWKRENGWNWSREQSPVNSASRQRYNPEPGKSYESVVEPEPDSAGNRAEQPAEDYAQRQPFGHIGWINWNKSS